VLVEQDESIVDFMMAFFFAAVAKSDAGHRKMISFISEADNKYVGTL